MKVERLGPHRDGKLFLLFLMDLISNEMFSLNFFCVCSPLSTCVYSTMSTSTNRASAFDTYHPVVTLLDTELALGPPLLSRHQFTNTHPHFDKDYFDCPPAYPPSSRYPRGEFSRVDVDALLMNACSWNLQR